MFTIFAHAGHDQVSGGSINTLDHCAPIIIAAGIIIAALFGIILYLLKTRRPETQSKTKPKTKKK